VTDDEDNERPWDGKTFGRLKVRGPAVSRAYYGGAGKEQFDEEEWFDTGDVAHIDENGYMQITDRAKDVIKSGGEWISTIDLENLAVGHPDVAEAAVIGVKPARHRQETGQEPHEGGPPRLHGRQDRQMVDAGRRGLRRRYPAHRDRQDPEDRAARSVQGVPSADGRSGRRLSLDQGDCAL
jgi:acyl-CoA synthetase (AMP-forming)/AMP-acid ligase II